MALKAELAKGLQYTIYTVHCISSTFSRVQYTAQLNIARVLKEISFILLYDVSVA